MSATKEEAIEALQKFVNGYEKNICGEAVRQNGFVQAIKVVISALRLITREQVEKVWRGEWIHAMPILGSGDEEIRCSKCGNIVGFETAFCPYCGSPITDNAMNIVMERLEALKDGSSD